MAQPPDQASGIETRDAAQVAREWATLRAAHLEEETTDPRAAIARYQKFYEERGRQSGAVSVAITSLIAQLYSQNLHDRDKALEIYRWGVQLFAWHPDGARLRREMELLQAGDKPNANGKPEVAPPDAPGGGESVAAVPPLAVPAVAVPPAIHLGTPLIPGALKVLPSASAPLPVGANRNGASSIPLNPAPSLAQVALLAQLQAEPGHAEALWQASGLSVDDLPPLIEKADESDAAHKASRLALAGLLVRHNGELLQAPEKLSSRLRLAVADYYASLPDEKAVALYEGLLQEEERAGPQKREPFALEKLAAYYQATNQFGKAAELMAQVERYTTVPALVGNGWVEAARLYRQAGENEKAESLYRKVIETPSGWGWARGLAIIDQAKTLIKQGRHDQARALLKAPLLGTHTDQIRIATLSLLGHSYYLVGDLEQAKFFSQAAIVQAASLKILQNEGLETHIAVAKATLSSIELWKSQPLIAEPGELKILIGHENKKLVRQKLYIRSLHAVSLNASSDNPQIRVWPMDGGWDTEDKGLVDVEKEVIVEIPREALNPKFSATLVFTSPTFPAFQLNVRVSLEQNKS